MELLPRDPLRGIAPPRVHGTAEAAWELLDPSSTLVITGAGLSTDAGIPDYRSPGAPQRRPMTATQFRSGPEQQRRYWARSYVGWTLQRDFRPTRGHRDLAALDPLGIVTQNVDGLHFAAGSQRVVELHGALDRVICLDCGTSFEREWLQREFDLLNPGFLDAARTALLRPEAAPDGDVELEATEDFRVRSCAVCAGVLKPDVVFFGDVIPPARAAEAEAMADAADAVLVLGSSLAVHSALRLVRRSAQRGAPIVIVTDGPSRADDLAAIRLVDRVGPFLAGWRGHRALSVDS